MHGGEWRLFCGGADQGFGFFEEGLGIGVFGPGFGVGGVGHEGAEFGERG